VILGGNGAPPGNTAGVVGGQVVNAGASFIYDNNLYQSRHNTQESAESSKSRNGGLNEHLNNNSTVYQQVQQINILTGPANANKAQAQQQQQNIKIDLSNNNVNGNGGAAHPSQ